MSAFVVLLYYSKSPHSTLLPFQFHIEICSCIRLTCCPALTSSSVFVRIIQPMSFHNCFTVSDLSLAFIFNVAVWLNSVESVIDVLMGKNSAMKSVNHSYCVRNRKFTKKKVLQWNSEVKWKIFFFFDSLNCGGFVHVLAMLRIDRDWVETKQNRHQGTHQLHLKMNLAKNLIDQSSFAEFNYDSTMKSAKINYFDGLTVIWQLCRIFVYICEGFLFNACTVHNASSVQRKYFPFYACCVRQFIFKTSFLVVYRPRRQWNKNILLNLSIICHESKHW